MMGIEMYGGQKPYKLGEPYLDYFTDPSEIEAAVEHAFTGKDPKPDPEDVEIDTMVAVTLKSVTPGRTWFESRDWRR